LRQYGKGRHAAGLNFGDCFSYALALSLGEPLSLIENDVIEGNSDPIYGENATILDIDLLAGSGTSNAADSADESE
jgi:hypothetical protein